MDKLEHYLDRVCRSIGGPRSLRKHVRQELREHLLDAVAEHRRAGLTEEEAIDRALADFGQPDEVRGELEALHGHRLLGTAIAKALDWKENTMKASWLWNTLAHLALVSIIIAQVCFLASIAIWIMPQYIKCAELGMLDISRLDKIWVHDWLITLLKVAYHLVRYWWAWILVVGIVWVLFERRVHSENKPFIRLTSLGFIATVLTAVGTLTGLAVAVTFVLTTLDLHNRKPEIEVRKQLAAIDAAMASLQQALANNDREAAKRHLWEASIPLQILDHMGAAAPAMLALSDQPKPDEIRARLDEAETALRNAQLNLDPEPLRILREAYQKLPGVRELPGAAAKPDSEPTEEPAGIFGIEPPEPRNDVLPPQPGEASTEPEESSELPDPADTDD